VSESTQTPEPSEQHEADGAAVAPESEADNPATSELDPPTAVTPAPASSPPASSPPAYSPPAPDPAPSASSDAPPPYTPAPAAGPVPDRPEVAVGAAFAGGLVLALILKRLAR
jgi:hypothetical protein